MYKRPTFRKQIKSVKEARYHEEIEEYICPWHEWLKKCFGQKKLGHKEG